VTPSSARAVLLDGLGTLLSLAPPGPALAAALLREHGIEITVGEAEEAFAAEMRYYREHHHEARDDVTLAALRRRCAQTLLRALPRRWTQTLGSDQLMAPMLASLRFSAYPDAAAALARLRGRGMRLVAVSNWDVGLPLVLRRVGLARYLDGAVTSGQVGHAKPAPSIFRAGIAVAGVSPWQAVHVGDSLENDVRGALRAGIGAVFLRRAGSEDPAELDLPADVPVIDSLERLPAVIAEQAG
jgi:putative hydrolase of the HAD superfamily